MGGYILLGDPLSLGVALLRVPGGLQRSRGVIEILGHGADVVVLKIGDLVYLARQSLPEEHVLQSVIAQDACVGGLDEVVEVRHGLLVAQHVGKVVGGHGPGVCVGVDRIDVGRPEEERLRILPVGAGGLPVVACLVEGFLRTRYYTVV